MKTISDCDRWNPTLTGVMVGSVNGKICDRRFLPTGNRRLLTACSLVLAAFAFMPDAGAQTNEPAASKESAPAPSRIDPKAQELLDQAVRALGGETFLSAKTLRTTGRLFIIREGSTAGLVPFESTVEFPNKRRFAYGKDKPVTLINDGQRGWQLDKYGMVRQPPEEVRLWNISARYGYENLLRAVIREPGLLVQDAGSEFEGPVATRVVSITDAQQTQIRIHLDAKKGLPVRVTFRLLHPESREWNEFSEVYADFREFQGIQSPRQITRFLNNDRTGETFRKTVEYNVEVPANYFTPGG